MRHILTIHTAPQEDEGSTWLQLFFDLVYVAILVELGNRLSHDLTGDGLVAFILIFVPIWWSWLEFVDYGRRYPVDDIGQRILTVLYMAAMLLMAFEIHAMVESASFAFVFTYGISKFILALMYGRAWYYYPEYRHLTRDRSLAYALISLAWFVLALSDSRGMWPLIAVIALGAVTPAVIRWLHVTSGRSSLPQPPLKYHFTLHRFGELTIIVLGEFFIKLATSSEGRELNWISYLIGAGLLAISVSIWWLYFDHLEHVSLPRAESRLWFWTYAHLPFMAAITLYGVIGNQIFAQRPGAPLTEIERILFIAALAVALLAYGIIEWASSERDEPLSRPAQPWLRVIGAAALLVLGFFAASLNVDWLVLVVMGILLIQVVLDARQRLLRPEPQQ
ncbi:MAG: low temperature requirement protein A [Chloroflexota bacterium]|jgi:low temperature requirement protein LtrA